MDVKLLGGAGLGDGPGAGRSVRIPAGLDEVALAALRPEEVGALVQRFGPGVGWAALFKLASGMGGTAASVQLQAARALVEGAAALAEAERAGEVKDALAQMDGAALAALIAALEEQRGAAPAVDVISGVS